MNLSAPKIHRSRHRYYCGEGFSAYGQDSHCTGHNTTCQQSFTGSSPNPMVWYFPQHMEFCSHISECVWYSFGFWNATDHKASQCLCDSWCHLIWSIHLISGHTLKICSLVFFSDSTFQRSLYPPTSCLRIREPSANIFRLKPCGPTWTWYHTSAVLNSWPFIGPFDLSYLLWPPRQCKFLWTILQLSNMWTNKGAHQ